MILRFTIKKKKKYNIYTHLLRLFICLPTSDDYRQGYYRNLYYLFAANITHVLQFYRFPFSSVRVVIVLTRIGRSYEKKKKKRK